MNQNAFGVEFIPTLAKRIVSRTSSWGCHVYGSALHWHVHLLVRYTNSKLGGCAAPGQPCEKDVVKAAHRAPSNNVGESWSRLVTVYTVRSTSVLHTPKTKGTLCTEYSVCTISARVRGSRVSPLTLVRTEYSFVYV